MPDYHAYEFGDWELDPIFRRGQSGFSFTPNPNDPELGMLRSGALREHQQRRTSNLNELARAGLLGSGVALRGVMGGADEDLASRLEGIREGSYGRQRREALDLYQGDLGFRRNLELSRLNQLLGLRSQAFGYDSERAMREEMAMMEALSGIGGLGGDLLTSYFTSMWGKP